MMECEVEFELGEPAEVLVDLARRGEIDPWDIDIALATEKFLQYIDSLESRDLRIPARTLLYASILLRLKSDQMEGQEEEEEIEPEEIEEAAPPREEVLDQLPRPPLRRHTKRPVTLDECKVTPGLEQMVLINNSRLSVQPVRDEEWRIICALGGVEP